MSLPFRAYLGKLVFLFYHRTQIWKLSPSQTVIDTRIIGNKTRDPPWLEQDKNTTNASWLDSGLRILACCRTIMIMLNLKETLQLPPSKILLPLKSTCLPPSLRLQPFLFLYSLFCLGRSFLRVFEPSWVFYFFIYFLSSLFCLDRSLSESFQSSWVVTKSC